jgi:malate synthase
MTHAAKSLLPPGVELRAPWSPLVERVLTPEAVAFVAELARTFGPRREQLLARRQEVAARLAAGEQLDFLKETQEVREADWQVSPLPEDLLDRRVEITGPAEAKMIINALNSGANVFMADLEDSLAPSFHNVVDGQRALAEAVRRTLVHEAPETGKRYSLHEKLATLFVRPRGWHLDEEHLYVDGQPVPGALFDFGLFFFHNAREQLARGTGPYFYLPKLESHLEARLWNDVFHHAQAALHIARGTIKACVLIETLPAAFEMDEILFELREHSAGLNCGRWDYIFSFIKKHASRADAVLPDRGQVTMDKGFLRAYSQLLVRTCHRRNVHAMGGMAAFIPVKGDEAANQAALDKVRADKLREVKDGHDGTWVAHPALVPVAREVFDAHMPTRNQLANKREDVHVTAADLLRLPRGTLTEAGLRQNIRVGIQYIEAWLRGQGCVPLYQLMEDAATAEISRAQVWQQLRYGASLEGLGTLTRETFERLVGEELERVKQEVGEQRFSAGLFPQARELFVRLSTSPTFEEFLTLPAYRQLVSTQSHV